MTSPGPQRMVKFLRYTYGVEDSGLASGCLEVVRGCDFSSAGHQPVAGRSDLRDLLQHIWHP